MNAWIEWVLTWEPSGHYDPPNLINDMLKETLQKCSHLVSLVHPLSSLTTESCHLQSHCRTTQQSYNFMKHNLIQTIFQTLGVLPAYIHISHTSRCLGTKFIIVATHPIRVIQPSFSIRSYIRC